MASINTVNPKIAAATVAEAEADPEAEAEDENEDMNASSRSRVIPLDYTRHRLMPSVWSVALMSSGACARHRCSASVLQESARHVGNGQVVSLEYRHHPWQVSCISGPASGSSVVKPPTRPRQSATTRRPVLDLGAAWLCETPLMIKASLPQHRPWPNPALKRNANSAPRWPSSAGPSAHFALAVRRATLPASA